MVHVGLGRGSSQVAPRLSSWRLLVWDLLLLLLLLLHHLLRVVADQVPGGLTGGEGLEADVGPGVVTAVQAGGHGGWGSNSS